MPDLGPTISACGFTAKTIVLEEAFTKLRCEIFCAVEDGKLDRREIGQISGHLDKVMLEMVEIRRKLGIVKQSLYLRSLR